MIRLILTADEACLAAVDALTEIRRPVEPQPGPEYVRAEIVGRWCHFEDELGPPNERGNREGKMFTVDCPWGAPGELLYACEAWAAHWMYGNLAPELSRSTHPDDNYWYMADGAHAPGSHGCPAHGRRGPWREAETMPVWAARFAYRGRVRVELADGVWQWVLAVERVNLNGAPVPPVECQ